MLVQFSDNFTKYTNDLPEIEVDCTTIGRGMVKLFDLFPQLYVYFMDNEGEVIQRTAMVLDGEFITDAEIVHRIATETTVLEIHRIVPSGEDSDTLGFFIDPLSARLISGKQMFGNMGYGWTMPGAKQMFGEKTADELAGYAMQIVGYIFMIVGAISGQLWLSVIGNLFVMMGNWSLDAAGRVTPMALNTGVNNSATYTFSGIRNTTASGTPFQIIYGTHRVGGHVLNMFTTAGSELQGPTEVTNTTLYAQIGLCEGEIEAVTDVQVNKLPLTYYNAVDTAPNPDYIRLGTSNQTVMPQFSIIENTTSVGKRVTNISSLPVAPSRLTANTKPVYGYVDSSHVFVPGPYVWTNTGD